MPQSMNRVPGNVFSTVLGSMALALAVQAPARAEEHPSHAPVLTPQVSGTVNRLQAISPVTDRIAWASGLKGTYVVTVDGGASWRAGVVPGAETLQFRDVQGVSATEAYLLSAGVGTDSRIYKTEDGGATWALQFQAPDDPNFFYDCFAFWSPERGITMADGLNAAARFPAIRTRDGETWQGITMPPAEPNEGAFAASGTCIATQGERRAWAVTTNSRVLRTADGGDTWAAYRAPIAGGTGTAGVFTVAFRDARHGIIGGGDFTAATVLPNVARSSDSGKTWQLSTSAPVPGAIFGLAYAQRAGEGEGDNDDEDGRAPRVVVTGPGGTAWTADEGQTWSGFAGVTGYWAVAFASPRNGWLVGTQGRILKIQFH